MQVTPTTHPISWFRDRNNERTLILKPPYQRKPVWAYKQRAYLIDTILCGYHIPEIYIHRETDAKGNSIYNVVDGQQRLRTILDFIAGEFALSEKFTPDYADFNFEDLPDSIKKTFWSYTLYIREITDAKEEDVKTFFKRMNRYVIPLNPQELRHATYQGDFIKLMEEISEDEFWAENKIVGPTEIRRMNDVQFISELFISMINGIQDRTKEMDKYYETYEEDFPDKMKWYSYFQKILTVLKDMFADIKDTRWRSKSDFYTLFIALSKMYEHSYIAQSKYPRVKKELLEFGEKVAEANKKGGKPQSFSNDVLKYANAVKRSTTNKDKRVARNKIIYKILSKYAEKQKTTSREK
ncbi:MAG: DUF262 domain-containing protein [Syntrophaceae bacterium]|nr:DUF262 domain-containing protein [Syntrophaceae bacterium]